MWRILFSVLLMTWSFCESPNTALCDDEIDHSKASQTRSDKTHAFQPPDRLDAKRAVLYIWFLGAICVAGVVLFVFAFARYHSSKSWNKRSDSDELPTIAQLRQANRPSMMNRDRDDLEGDIVDYMRDQWNVTRKDERQTEHEISTMPKLFAIFPGSYPDDMIRGLFDGAA